ncbi:hypothetical protein Scep_002035 [Stephania cephalantha]|uniref:Uncharacterized protein n=2 Tax=Stephania cephalantha TaxID=152367 RepID=A0AAP0LD66_9MAGN
MHLWSQSSGAQGRDRWELREGIGGRKRKKKEEGNEKMKEMRDKKPDLFLVSVLKVKSEERKKEERERKRDGEEKKWRRGRDRAGEEEEEEGGVARWSDPAANQWIRRRTAVPAAARSDEGPRTVAPARRESNGRASARKDRTRGGIGAHSASGGRRYGRTGETARRRADEEQRHGEARCARTSLRHDDDIGSGGRDAATPAKNSKRCDNGEVAMTLARFRRRARRRPELQCSGGDGSCARRAAMAIVTR